VHAVRARELQQHDRSEQHLLLPALRSRHSHKYKCQHSVLAMCAWHVQRHAWTGAMHAMPDRHRQRGNRVVFSIGVPAML
jgi:hypothetical protein